MLGLNIQFYKESSTQVQCIRVLVRITADHSPIFKNTSSSVVIEIPKLRKPVVCDFSSEFKMSSSSENKSDTNGNKNRQYPTYLPVCTFSR